ncbi:MAG: glycosyl hydrolase family 17 protein [Candidatus Omnitrophota bacterium]
MKKFNSCHCEPRRYRRGEAIFLVLFLFFVQFAFANPGPEFRDKVSNLKWIAYAPTNFDPTANRYPSDESLLRDLTLLYNYGFRGVVTYGAASSLADIPRIAKSIGFQGAIMGIWDIDSREEITNATLAVEYVDGYCVGNEGLNSRYSLEDLNQVIASLKHSTGKPVTTTEQIFDYYNDKVLNIGDWIFPNIHPFLSEVKEPKKAVQWIGKHYKLLRKHAGPERIILFKEVGWPTSGASEATESNQKRFFLNMQKSDVPFVYFEAFDQRWKDNLSVEPHWGLFTPRRSSKRFASSVR